MTRFLLAADTVHAAAACCDYLADRVESGDEVIGVTVVETGDGDPPADSDRLRDAEDALNVATVRLPVAVETRRREGDPATEIVAAAGDAEVGEIVLAGGRSGEIGSTLAGVLAVADRPVVVVSAG